MPKIDFESDSAPFSGAVLPTIEDVAALGDRVEREIVDPVPRIDPTRASTVQKLVLPFALFLTAGVAVMLHLAAPSALLDAADESAAGPPISILPATDIPLGGVKDVRVVALSISPEVAELALRAARTARVTLVVSRESGTSPALQQSLASAKVTLYPVPPSMVVSQGVLLDGLRWYPLTP